MVRRGGEGAASSGTLSIASMMSKDLKKMRVLPTRYSFLLTLSWLRSSSQRLVTVPARRSAALDAHIL